MYRCADEKISKTENKVTVAYCDVENLDHQNWQLLEGKSYITSISIIKQKISLKNGTGSGFGRKKGRDGGIEKKKKGGKEGFENPYCGPSSIRCSWHSSCMSNLLFLVSFSMSKHTSMASCAIYSNFFEEQWTQNHPQYLSGLSRALHPTTFLEIAVYK